MQFIIYPVDANYSLQYTGRKTWEAKLFHKNKPIDIIPVTWTRPHDLDPTRGTLWVYFRDDAIAMLKAREPWRFYVATASAKDWHARPLKFNSFNAIYEVKSTGMRENKRILTDIIRLIAQKVV
jgi:hypothetical protein